MHGGIDGGGLQELQVKSNDPWSEAIEDAEPASLTMSRRYGTPGQIGCGGRSPSAAVDGLPVRRCRAAQGCRTWSSRPGAPRSC
jgi:hypothetical protein